MFRSILVPVDLEQESTWQFALPQAVELAGLSGGVVTVMTVVRDLRTVFEGVAHAFQLEALIRQAGTKLALIIGELPESRVAVRQEVRVGSIGREIVTASVAIGADLILMASHRPELRDFLIGPNAAFVCQHAACSVLVLRRFS